MIDQPAIERLILAQGQRGMDRLAPALPPDYAAQAAEALWAARARVLLTTGFHVAGHPETDGPPGAYFLGRALAHSGAQIAFVADAEPLALLHALFVGVEGDRRGKGGGPAPQFIEFPITDAAASAAFAAELTATWQPTAVVAVERCGRTASGRYLNMRGADITPWTAQVDGLFTHTPALTVGIGDGGNEIGMGGLAAQITAELGIAEPALTPAQHLVLTTVSNWGAYGLIAYLSRHAGRDLLPTDEEEATALRLLVEGGAVHGLTQQPEPWVDGFPLATTLALLAALRAEIGRPDGA